MQSRVSLSGAGPPSFLPDSSVAWASFNASEQTTGPRLSQKGAGWCAWEIEQTQPPALVL